MNYFPFQFTVTIVQINGKMAASNRALLTARETSARPRYIHHHLMNKPDKCKQSNNAMFGSLIDIFVMCASGMGWHWWITFRFTSSPPNFLVSLITITTPNNEDPMKGCDLSDFGWNNVRKLTPLNVRFAMHIEIGFIKRLKWSDRFTSDGHPVRYCIQLCIWHSIELIHQKETEKKRKEKKKWIRINFKQKR